MGLGEVRLHGDRLFISRGGILQPAEFRQRICPIEVDSASSGLNAIARS